MIDDHAEAQRVSIEPQTPFLVANEDDDEVQTEIGLFAIQAQQGSLNPKGQFGTRHRRDYKRA
jgi:hypothetical protein